MIMINDDSLTLLPELENVCSIEIFKGGLRKEYGKGDAEFDRLFSSIHSIFSTGRLAPAFCVSLHDDTVEQLNSGNWIKLNFSNIQTKNDLPFNCLLFRADKTYGLNLIRGYNNRFDGRCLYMDFSLPIEFDI